MHRSIFMVIFVALLIFVSGCSPSDEVYTESISPDGTYKIVVVRHPQYFAAPGQGSDAPGTIRLIDKAGNVLQEEPVAMVQLVEHIDWTPQRVIIKLLIDWELPPAAD